MHDADHEEVEVGDFGELVEEVEGDEVEERVFGCFDFVGAGLVVGEVGDDGAVGHLLERGARGEEEALGFVGVRVFHGG